MTWIILFFFFFPPLSLLTGKGPWQITAESGCKLPNLSFWCECDGGQGNTMSRRLHLYHWRTQICTWTHPAIAFAAASQPFSTQVYIHNPTPAVAAHVPHPASVTPSPPSSSSPMSSHPSPSEQQLNMDHTPEDNSPTPPHQPCGDTPWSTNEPSLSDPPSQSPDTSDISSGSSYEMSEEESSSSDSDGEPDDLHLCKERKYVVFESQRNRLLYSLHCNACANGHIAEL